VQLVQCADVCRSVSQCVAVCRSVSQCDPYVSDHACGTHFKRLLGHPQFETIRVLQCGAVCCSVFQCSAICCSVLQCVPVCCSVMHCVAVCRSVLHIVIAVCVPCLPYHGRGTHF